MAGKRAAGNRTITICEDERVSLKAGLFYPNGGQMSAARILNKTMCADLFSVLDLLPHEFVDLLIIDPPYNLDKNFNGLKFMGKNDDAYLDYLKSWFPKILNTLKPNGSVYICGDWKSTFCLYQIMRDNTTIRNRIIWQREKGRGQKQTGKTRRKAFGLAQKAMNTILMLTR